IATGATRDPVERRHVLSRWFHAHRIPRTDRTQRVRIKMCDQRFAIIGIDDRAIRSVLLCNVAKYSHRDLPGAIGGLSGSLERANAALLPSIPRLAREFVGDPVRRAA